MGDSEGPHGRQCDHRGLCMSSQSRADPPSGKQIPNRDPDDLWKDVFLDYMDVSDNSGTPKSSILIGFSIINYPCWGTIVFGNTHIHPTQLDWPGGGFNSNIYSFFHPAKLGEDEPNLTSICFKWVEATNQLGIGKFVILRIPEPEAISIYWKVKF